LSAPHFGAGAYKRRSDERREGANYPAAPSSKPTYECVSRVCYVATTRVWVE
jgi:hypothetical protein